jgi:hypothetical protein
MPASSLAPASFLAYHGTHAGSDVGNIMVLIVSWA